MARYCTPRSQVVHQTREISPLTFPLPDGHSQGVQGQVGVQARGGLPADDPPRVHIGHESHIDPPREGAYIGGGTSRLRRNAGEPQLVRPEHAEMPFDQFGRAPVLGAERVVLGDLARLTPRRPRPPMRARAVHRAT